MNREFERIGALSDRLRRRRDDVVLGMGDDAAVLEASTSRQVLTVDVAVEGVHFDRAFGTPRDMGYRAYMIAASDLAAMGARGRAALLALVLPPDVDDPMLLSLIDGVAAAADEVGAPVVGGNLSSGTELSITTTLVGEVDGEPLRRSGAKPGDALFVTGEPGAAALGLHWLRAGRSPEDDSRASHCVARYLRPRARMEGGQRLLGHATAAIDVSDGLLQDLGHICEASGVGAEVHVSPIPQAAGFTDLAHHLGVDPTPLALTAGDDYELLFAAAADDAVARQVGTAIGTITAGHEVTVRAPDGTPLHLQQRGFDHF